MGVPRGDKTGHKDTRERGELRDRHLHGPRNLMGPAFVARDGHAGRVQLFGELFLGQSQDVTSLLEFVWRHVTNRYTERPTLSTPNLGSLA